MQLDSNEIIILFVFYRYKYEVLVGTSVDSNKKKHLLEEIKYMNMKTAFEEVAKSSACRDYLKKKGLLK